MPVLEVADPADPRLADFTRATDVALRGARGTEHGLYLAESALVLERALGAGHEPRAVLALGGAVGEAVDLVGDDVPVYTAPADVLSSVTGYALHRGIIASMHRPALRPPEELFADARRVVILEHVVDPTNVGAIFRSVAGVGADAVFVSADCADPFYRRAIRVSMGTVLQVPWTRLPDWSATRGLLTASGFHVAALALKPGAVSLRDFRAPDRLALVLGAESTGLTRDALAASDTIVQIPMRHGIDSLNVAAAAAVAMWAVGE